MTASHLHEIDKIKDRYAKKFWKEKVDISFSNVIKLFSDPFIVNILPLLATKSSYFLSVLKEVLLVCGGEKIPNCT